MCWVNGCEQHLALDLLFDAQGLSAFGAANRPLSARKLEAARRTAEPKGLNTSPCFCPGWLRFQNRSGSQVTTHPSMFSTLLLKSQLFIYYMLLLKSNLLKYLKNLFNFIQLVIFVSISSYLRKLWYCDEM